MRLCGLSLCVLCACAAHEQRKVEFREPMVIEGRAGSDAEMDQAIAAYRSGDHPRAAAQLQRIAQQSTGQRRASALIQLGVVRIEDGARGEGAELEREAVRTLDAIRDERVDPALASQAEYWLGEAARAELLQAPLDPSGMDDRALADAVEAKADRLLAAQDLYLRCIRRGDPDWATAAGYRIGELYEAFHDQLVRAPQPQGLTPEQRTLYDEALRTKVRTLLEKAVRAYDETVSAAERTGAKTEYVEKARASMERLRAELIGAN